MKRLAILPCLIFSCSTEDASVNNISNQEQAAWFENNAKSMGLNPTWHSGASGKFYMPEIIGGGAAVLDYDNDGDLDVYFVQGGSIEQGSKKTNLLFENNDGYFTDVTEQSQTGDVGYGMGVATGDYDNNGFTDLYITNVGSNVLLQNNGDGTFTDVTNNAGVGDDGWGASAAFADFDSDGDLDLYSINYLVWNQELEIDCFNEKGTPDYCSPINYMAPARDLLYKNNGDGTFTDMSELAGLGSRLGTGLGVLCNDYTGDGRIDIFVANDGMADQLWMNNGDWTFTDVAALRGCALDDEGKAKAGMGVSSDDYDFDGDLDIIVCNLTNESDSMYRNDGDYFTDVTAKQGIRTSTRHATRFGLGLIDFNNDGFLDLYEANGRVQQMGTTYTDDPFAEPNYLLEGSKSGWNKLSMPILDIADTSRAAVFADLNNDGGVDIFVANKDSEAYALMNVHPNAQNAVTISVLNTHGSPSLGAIVRCKVGEKQITKVVQTAYSYLSANDPRIHIGLGEADVMTDVSVQWLDGSVTQFADLQQGFATLKQP